jgi:hypothetical protein
MAQSDILVSPAWLWYAPEGEGNPDETTVDVGDDWSGNWTWLGLTTAPLTLSTSSTEFSVDVQQLTTPILSSITSEQVTIKTTLAEQTAENLKLLFGGNISTTSAASGQKGFTELAFGGRTSRTVYKFGFEVKTLLDDGTEEPLRLFFHRGQITQNGDMVFDKGGVAAIPIQITVLSDDSQDTDEKLGVWQKVTAKATTT